MDEGCRAGGPEEMVVYRGEGEGGCALVTDREMDDWLESVEYTVPSPLPTSPLSHTLNSLTDVLTHSLTHSPCPRHDDVTQTYMRDLDR